MNQVKKTFLKEKNTVESNEDKHEIKEIFRSVYCEKIWVSINELEDVQNLSELEGLCKVAKLNVMTRSMLEYDESYFFETSFQKPDEYRPYFYSYIVYMDAQSDINAFNRLREMESKWFIADFKKTNHLGWYEYYGAIEKSASPVIIRNRRIYISDEELDQTTVDRINNAYPVKKASNDSLVRNCIKAILNNVHFTSSRVYKIGNGNLISLNGNSFVMMYDIGYHSIQSKDEKRTKYGNAIKSFKSIKPNVVILSHWDDDHIMGCAYARSELFECPWFAPEIEKKNAIGAKRLAAYLTVKNKLTVIQRQKDARKLVEICGTNSVINFYVGENKKKGSITKENCGGIVVEIKNRNRGKTVESLFCGDVPYEAISTVLWNCRSIGYDNLLVPHHGSKMECKSLKIKQHANAIVCGNNKKNRPECSHKNSLEAGGKGYNIQVTEDAKNSWIDLTLG